MRLLLPPQVLLVSRQKLAKLLPNQPLVLLKSKC
jgi:hypothetical protein